MTYTLFRLLSHSTVSPTLDSNYTRTFSIFRLFSTSPAVNHVLNSPGQNSVLFGILIFTTVYIKFYTTNIKTANRVQALSYVYTLRLIGLISYSGECYLINGSLTKAHRNLLTNAFCYLRVYITCTKIRNRPD